MTEHEVLVAALNHLERYGWRAGSGQFGQPRGRQCVMGHVLAVCGMEHKQARRALAASMGVDGAWVSRWNDVHTEEQVVDAVHRAIASTAPEPEVPEVVSLSADASPII